MTNVELLKAARAMALHLQEVSANESCPCKVTGKEYQLDEVLYHLNIELHGIE